MQSQVGETFPQLYYRKTKIAPKKDKISPEKQHFTPYLFILFTGLEETEWESTDIWEATKAFSSQEFAMRKDPPSPSDFHVPWLDFGWNCPKQLQKKKKKKKKYLVLKAHLNFNGCWEFNFLRISLKVPLCSVLKRRHRWRINNRCGELQWELSDVEVKLNTWLHLARSSSSSVSHLALKTQSSVSLPYLCLPTLYYCSCIFCQLHPALSRVRDTFTSLLLLYQQGKPRSFFVQAGMTCSWSSLVCILVSSSKEMPNTSWSLISCSVLPFPVVWQFYQLRSWTPLQKTGKIQTPQLRLRAVWIVCAMNFSTTSVNIAVKCSRDKAHQSQKCPVITWHKTPFLCLVLIFPFLCKAREAVYNSCSPGWSC